MHSITAESIEAQFSDQCQQIGPAAERNQVGSLHGLTKSYSELEVLRGVDFEVARGSIFALLGSNGAGKTTVVKIVSVDGELTGREPA